MNLSGGDTNERPKDSAKWRLHLHVVHEERVVRPGRDDTDFDPVLRVPVQELVVHKHLQKYRTKYSLLSTADVKITDTVTELESRISPCQGSWVVDGPLPVGEESVLVLLDVGRTPAVGETQAKQSDQSAANQQAEPAETELWHA